MGNFDEKIFKGKKFSDLLSEIYENQKKKESQISALISELKPLVNDIGDATLLVPLIKEYMDLGIKNDEQLIKMATIIQRSMNNKGGEASDLALSDREKEDLLKLAQEYKSPPKKDD